MSIAQNPVLSSILQQIMAGTSAPTGLGTNPPATTGPNPVFNPGGAQPSGAGYFPTASSMGSSNILAALAPYLNTNISSSPSGTQTTAQGSDLLSQIVAALTTQPSAAAPPAQAAAVAGNYSRNNPAPGWQYTPGPSYGPGATWQWLGATAPTIDPTGAAWSNQQAAWGVPIFGGWGGAGLGSSEANAGGTFGGGGGSSNPGQQALGGGSILT